VGPYTDVLINFHFRETTPDYVLAAFSALPCRRSVARLVPGTAAELEYLTARPSGFGTVMVDRGTAAGKHQVVELRMRVERFIHHDPRSCSIHPQRTGAPED
jgi:hypothetical protein